ncbi:segregation/condensation protein A [Salibacterium aidingense]|uniref:segregation/condensation protein A n=1 Tax=Salibacterium aidingense TaxID=384933 RepID=UPI00041287C4|nr:segregation/condensation protein A [Salibacterium aidingense]
MERYNVHIDTFQGPLDLLLHLIHQAEVDIYDIPVASITEQYLRYVQAMQELELDIASEYLVMAATLLEIKSKMLLPGDPEPEEEYIEEEDPREELLSRLVEYKKYKEAAEALRDKENQGVVQYAKGPSMEYDDAAQEADTAALPEELTLFDMLDAYQKLKERVRYHAPKTTKIKGEEISIEERMSTILAFLHERKGSSGFFELFPSREKAHIVVSFLAVLELMKTRQITCVQSENFEEIKVYQTEEELVSE